MHAASLETVYYSYRLMLYSTFAQSYYNDHYSIYKYIQQVLLLVPCINLHTNAIPK